VPYSIVGQVLGVNKGSVYDDWQNFKSHSQDLQQALRGVPAHFFSNLGEIGHQSWADALRKICYVPIEL
jgi:hypothetical protein